MADQTKKPHLFTPPKRVSEDAYFPTFESYEKLYAQSLENPDAFWGSQAEVQIDWFHKFTQVSDCDLRTAWWSGSLAAS